MSQQLTDSNFCWVDGKFLPTDAAILSSADPGVMLGMGVFDSLCAYNGKAFDLEKHYARLMKDAEAVGLEAPDLDVLSPVLSELVQRNGFSKGRCRLRVSVFAKNGGGQSLVVNATGLPQRNEFSSVIVVPYKVNEYSPLTGVKSSSYAANSLILQSAATGGADEAIMLNTSGYLCEGATSNLFLVKNGELYTPCLSTGCLPGVTRDTVLEIARELGVIYHTRDLSLNDVFECDEAFLTSSLRELQSIEKWDGEAMPTVNGSLVQRLREAYQDRAWH